MEFCKKSGKLTSLYKENKSISLRHSVLLVPFNILATNLVKRKKPTFHPSHCVDKQGHVRKTAAIMLIEGSNHLQVIVRMISRIHISKKE